MKTKLNYLSAPESISLQSELIDILEIDGKKRLIFGETPFYPQGGGQPSDTGYIKQHGEVIGKITHVSLNAGLVMHQVENQTIQFRIGDTYCLEINNKIRDHHSQLHTAGELICVALSNMGFKAEMISSAKHWPGQCQIVLNTQLNEVERTHLKIALQDEISKLVAANHQVNIITVKTREEAVTLTGYDPEYIDVQDDIRLVQIGAHARPCMGTHVSSLNELDGIIMIRSVKRKKHKTSISYELVVSQE